MKRTFKALTTLGEPCVVPPMVWEEHLQYYRWSEGKIIEGDKLCKCGNSKHYTWSPMVGGGGGEGASSVQRMVRGDHLWGQPDKV